MQLNAQQYVFGMEPWYCTLIFFLSYLGSEVKRAKVRERQRQRQREVKKGEMRIHCGEHECYNCIFKI